MYEHLADVVKTAPKHVALVAVEAAGRMARLVSALDKSECACESEQCSDDVQNK